MKALTNEPNLRTDLNNFKPEQAIGATSGIDWASKTEPWCWIGPQFRRQCEQIIAERVPEPPFQHKPRKPKPGRRHHDAALPDPNHQQAITERAAEVAAAKAALQTKHDLRAAGVTRNPVGRHAPKERFFEDDDQDHAAQEIIRAARHL